MKFVKLGVAENDQEPRFYRRIPLLDCLNGGVFFLKRHAVLLAKGEPTGDIRNVNLNEYTIQLYFIDEDGDKLLLCNDLDVRDAIQQRQSSLKICALVDAPLSSKSTQTAIPRTTETGTQPSPPPPLVDALADVLNCVVASANASLAAVEQSLEDERAPRSTVFPEAPRTTVFPEAPRSTVIPEAPRTTVFPEAPRTTVFPEAPRTTVIPEVPRSETPRSTVQSVVQQAARTSSEALKLALEQASAHTSKATHFATKATHYAERKVNKAVAKAEKQMAKTELKIEEALAAISKAAEKPRPVEATLFIHGRHTCDACLTTPIIGDRYHATNMSDYDLCAKCHEQYQGSEITFEVARLDRDAGMQDRWRTKYARLERLGGRRGGRSHGRWSEARGHAPPVPPAAPTMTNVEAYNEIALEQALRQSLEEFKASAPKEEVYAHVAPAATGVKVEETCDEEASVEKVEAKESMMEEAKKSLVEEPSKESKEDELTNTAKEEELSSASTPARAVEVPVESYAPVPKIVCSRADEETEAGETIVSGKSAVFHNHNSPSNVSFVEQDAGSIEHFLGETLDRVATAIDNLMIVDGADDEEIQSQDSWSVVNEDENLARAAEMIGSALFHSDNNVGSQFSSVSSVPTNFTNLAMNQLQFNRWMYHLERLHELGFYDDAKNVATLERLMAANIGVESNEDVTLEQVVNALMQGN